MDFSRGERLQKSRNTGKGLCGGEMLALESGLFGIKFRACQRELSPGVEDFARLLSSSLILVGLNFKEVSCFMKRG